MGNTKRPFDTPPMRFHLEQVDKSFKESGIVPPQNTWQDNQSADLYLGMFMGIDIALSGLMQMGATPEATKETLMNELRIVNGILSGKILEKLPETKIITEL